VLNYGNVPGRATATEVSFTDPDETEMGNSEELEVEHIIHDQKKARWSSEKEQSAGIERGGKIQKLAVVDTGKQYSDSVKEIGKELRRSWVRISITILIEQKRHRFIYIYIYIYGAAYVYIQNVQEECARRREGVPYVKVYRYNPKHLCPKLNG
jgi:hypothetical protein